MRQIIVTNDFNPVTKFTFSDHQLAGLERRFEAQRYLSTPERVELATALNLSETQVVFFQLIRP